MDSKKAASGGTVSLLILALLAGITIIPGAAAAVPAITAATYADTDGNGLIDTVTITWDNALDSGTVIPGDFTVGGEAPIGCGTTGTACTSGVTTTLRIKEKATLDAGAKPPVVYTAGSAKSGGDPAVTQTFSGGADSIAPALLGITGEAGSDTAYAFFSESVALMTPTNAGDPPVCITGSANVLQTDVSTVTVTGNRVAVKFSKNLVAEDVDNDATSDLAIQFREYDVGGTACTANDAVADPAGNDFVAGAGVAVRQAANLAAPTFDVAVGTTQVRVNFPVGVTGASGTALQASDFSYVNGATGGASNVASVSHTAGSNFATLTLNNPLTADDATAGIGDEITLTGKVSGSGAAFTFSTVDLVGDAIAPYIMSAKTVGDGTITHIEVTLSETVDDTGCAWAAGKWALTSSPAGATIAGVHSNAANTCVGSEDNKIFLELGGTPVTDTAASFTIAYDDTGVIQDKTLNSLIGNAGIATTDGAFPAISSAMTHDSDADGILDGIKLTYTEPIADSSINSANFALSVVTGYSLTGTTTGTTANDATVILTMTGPGGADSEVEPTLAYTPGTAADASGNKATAYAPTLTVDGAIPVITAVSGVSGGATLQVTVSEPVDDGAGGALAITDFGYANGGAGAVQGISSVSFVAGAETGTIQLDAPLGTSDLASDKLFAQAGQIVDLAGSTLAAATTQVGIVSGTALTISTVETMDANADGTLDVLIVTFSESVEDGTACNGAGAAFDAADWSVGVNGELATVGAALLDDSGTGACTLDDDAVWAIGFTAPASPVENWMTDGLPSLGFTNAGSDNVKAVATGNPLATVAKTSVDKAPPAILSVGTNPGTSEVTYTFSEPARGSGSSNLFVIGDLSYANTNAGGATGLNPILPSHTVPTETLTVKTNGAVVVADLGADTAGVGTTIADAGGNMPLAHVKVLTDSVDPLFTAFELHDSNGDGTAESVKVTLSENLDDGTGTCQNLDVAAWTARIGATNVPLTAVDSDASGACAENDDNIIFLRFTTQQAGNAAILLDYDPSGPTVDLVDLSGNTLDSTLTGQAVTDKVLPILPAANVLTRDLDGDGHVDALQLTFTEPVDDSTFVASHWDYTGQTITGINTGTTPDDEVIQVTIAESNAFDTGVVKGLTFTGPSLTDLNGNELAAIGAGAITATDGAGAAVTMITANVGDTTFVVKFSEAVTAAASGENFAFHDVDAAGAGIVTAAAGTGTDTITLTLNAALTAADIAGDKIQGLNTLIDANGVASPFAARLISGTVSDTTPPGQITNLATTAGVEQLTLGWTAPTASDLASYDIRISTTPITTTTAFNGAQSISTNGLGDAATIPAPVSGTTQSVTVTGLTAGTTYYFAMTTKDTTGNEAILSNSPSGIPEAPDTTAPAAITDLAASGETGNSVVLTWSPVGDDGSTGTVASYEIRFATSAITTIAEFNAATLATSTFDPATLLAGTATSDQTATVTGLAAATTYHIAVLGVDDAGNKGTFDSATFTTSSPDTTAPTGTLVISSATHTGGGTSTNGNPSFSWTGLTDDESAISYDVTLSLDGTLVRNLDTSETTFSATDLAAGQYTLTVIGESQGGPATAATFVFTVTEAADDVLDTEDAKALSEGIDLGVSRKDGKNTISWDNTGVDLGDVESMEIFVFNSPGVKITTITGTDIEEGTFTHSGDNAKEGSTYLATFVLTGGIKSYAGDAPDDGDFETTETSAEDKKLTDEDWFWPLVITLIVIVIVILLIIVILAIARRSKESEDEGDHSWVEEEESSFQGWAEPETGGHEEIDLRCPNCATEFHVSGVRPIETTCPGCQVAGTID